jgi:hypothetical protein
MQKFNFSGDLLKEEMDVLMERDNIPLVGLWTQGADTDEERGEIARTLMNSGYQFDRLRNILKAMYREAQSREEKVSNPNWRDTAAYELGYKKALRDVYRLLPKTTKE